MLTLMRLSHALILPITGLALAYAPIFGTFSNQECQSCVDSAFNLCVGSDFAACLCLDTGLGAAELALCASSQLYCGANTADVAQITFGYETYCVQYYPKGVCPSASFVTSVCATATRTTIQAVTTTSITTPKAITSTNPLPTESASIASISSQTRVASSSTIPSTSPTITRATPTTTSQTPATTEATSTAAVIPSSSISASASTSTSFVQVTSGAGASRVQDRVSTNGIVGACVLGLVNILDLLL